LRYLSLFSGIEAATQAWSHLGWEAVAFSEIEQFPCAVLDHHYPNVPNLGDITKITESQIKKLGHIDLIVFGSPCQDLSIAGKRKGLDGERSGLFTTAIKIIKWARKHNGARFALWENVPGAFSSNGGKDFREVIKLLSGANVECEKWSTSGVAIGKEGLTEWRVLDAKHFGVPQRRRRIFALADFGDWTDRKPILFESEGVCRDIEKSKEARKGYTNHAGTLAANGGGLNRPAGNANELDFCIPDTMATLNASDANKWGSNQWVDEGKALCVPINDKATRYNGKTGKGLGIGKLGDPSPTLTAGDKHALAFTTNDAANDVSANIAPTLRSGGDGGVVHQAVFYDMKQHHNPQPTNDIGLTTGNCTTIRGDSPLVRNDIQVRRLTPIECERLQGFPDNFTRIPYKNKDAENCPDSPRYKALGNSMAVPVMKWIGERIEVNQ
jgi:DNA (cytosine-5)-methyltransferase 1